MADDLGVVYTDKRLSDLEKSLRRVYSQASKDIDKKIEAFTKKSEAEEKRERAKLDAGKITQEEFDKWRKDNLFTGQKWNAQKADIAGVLANANNIANNMVRGEQFNVFGFNANYAAYQMEHGFGVNLDFSLYDKTTVERLLRDDPNILPFKKLDKMKDARWNFKNMKSQITQGLLAGDSIPKIAQRLASVVPDRNEKQMILHARTAMTAAQNGGRMERYKEAEDLGINFKKVWLATLDDRTRDEHAELDGQAVDPDEDFEVDGYRIAYPGDPHADPAMVYNCRCTLITKLVDYPSSFDRRGKNEDDEYENFGSMTYKEWEQAKQAKAEEPTAHVVVQGKDISESWQRRPDQFDFVIEDVINAQGFDGLPIVVSAEEFDKAVQESSFIAQRTYSAPNQETLDAYRESLYDGKWYLECSGGSVYGNGMYCSADFSGKLSENIKGEMNQYMRKNGETLSDGVPATNKTKEEIIHEYIKNNQLDEDKARATEIYLKSMTGLGHPSREEAQFVKETIGSSGMKNLRTTTEVINHSYEGCRTYVETFTLDPSAKFINYHDAYTMRDEYAKTFFGNEYRAIMKMDVGSFAAMKGYDAVVASEASGGYVIVLNRTKCIFKEG